MIPFTITPKSITLVLDNRHRQLDASHVNFDAVKNWLKVGTLSLDSLRELVDIPSFIAKVSEGRVQISDNEVRFDGETVHGHIAERLLALLREGLPVLPLMRFMERLAQAPIAGVKDQFLRWVEKSNLPLTEDGCVIAYKYVNADYKDAHTNTIDNSLGASPPRLEPNSINTNRNVTCAQSGYHFCSFGYLGGSHPHVMLVKIAPEDVCSFPDSEEAKGRCLWYKVVGEVPADELGARKVEASPIYDGMYAPPSHELVVAGAVGSTDEDEGYSNEDADVLEDVGVDLNVLDRARAAEEGAAKPISRPRLAERLKGITYQGKRLTQKRLMKLVGKVGQREASRRTGIPRSTMQGWLD